MFAYRTRLDWNKVTQNGEVIGDKSVDGRLRNGWWRGGSDDEIKYIALLVSRIGDVLSEVGVW